MASTTVVTVRCLRVLQYYKGTDRCAWQAHVLPKGKSSSALARVSDDTNGKAGAAACDKAKAALNSIRNIATLFTAALTLIFSLPEHYCVFSTPIQVLYTLQFSSRPPGRRVRLRWKDTYMPSLSWRT